MKIAVYAIARDEGLFAARFAVSAREADLVLVADTGSSDHTVAELEREGVVVHRISIDPWRFDDARNAALALVPADIDICVSLDLDEVLAPGWRPLLEQAWAPGTTRATYSYAFSHLQDGSPGIQFLADRIHARRGYRWRHACHEALYPDRIEEKRVAIPALRVDHYPDPAKSRASYLLMLDAAAREEPGNPRMAHYLGREFLYERRHAEGAAELERYLSLPAAIWAPERAASMIYLARCLEALGDGDGALDWRRRAVVEDPTMREAWVDLAEMLYRLSDWPACHEAALQALEIEEPTGAFMTEPRAWGPLAADLAALAAWHLGDSRAAARHAAAALTLDPDDERLRKNLELFEAASASAPSVNPGRGR